MSARTIIESAVQLEQLSELETLADQGSEVVIAYCEAQGLRWVASKDRGLIAVNGEWMLDTGFGRAEELAGWIEMHGEDKVHEFDLPLRDFSADFWERPEPLYHATDIENVEAIQRDGIQRRSRSRGLSNKWVGAAVYTTTEEDEAAVSGMGPYGDTVFRIDTGAMKVAGYTPRVSQEPAVEAYELRRQFASFLRAEGYETWHEDDMSPTTVVVHGDIPPQYLELLSR